MLVGGLDLGVVMAFDIGVFLVPQLMRDLLGFLLDHRGGQIKADHLVQLVQHRALHHGAGGPGIFGFQAFLDLAAQGVQAFGAELLGQIVVQLRLGGGLHVLDLALEHGGFAGQVLGAVFLGESDLDVLLVTRLAADQLLLEAGDEAVRAQREGIILGRTAFESLAIDLAEEIDHDLVALFRRAVLGLEILCRLGQTVQRFLHVGLGRGHDHLLQRDRLEIDLGDLGQLFIGHRDDDIVALFPVLVDHLDLGLHRRAVAGFLKVALHRAIDAFLHRLADEARAELFLEQRHRHLALAKALHLDFGLRLGQFLIDLGGQLVAGDGDLVAALEAVVGCLGNLHCNPYSSWAGPLPRERQFRGLLCVCAQACKGHSGHLADRRAAPSRQPSPARPA